MDDEFFFRGNYDFFLEVVDYDENEGWITIKRYQLEDFSEKDLKTFFEIVKRNGILTYDAFKHKPDELTKMLEEIQKIFTRHLTIIKGGKKDASLQEEAKKGN